MLIRLRWALAWAVLILLLCLLPGSTLPAWHWADLFSVDKGVHAGLFGVQSILALRAFGQSGAPAGPGATVLLLLVCIAYGGCLELMQQLPALGRRGDWNDFAANAIGSFAGWVWHRHRSASRRHAKVAADT